MDTKDLTPKCLCQEIDVALEPVVTDWENDETNLIRDRETTYLPNANTIDEYPALVIMPGKLAHIDIGSEERGSTIQREHA